MYSGPETSHRTMSSLRDFYGGHQIFNHDQKEKIVRQFELKE